MLQATFLGSPALHHFCVRRRRTSAAGKGAGQRRCERLELWSAGSARLERVEREREVRRAAPLPVLQRQVVQAGLTVGIDVVAAGAQIDRLVLTASPCRSMESTLYATFAGLPGISVPAGFGTTGLPTGLQLIGPPRGDGALLQLAYAYEEAAQDVVNIRPALKLA